MAFHNDPYLYSIHVNNLLCEISELIEQAAKRLRNPRSTDSDERLLQAGIIGDLEYAISELKKAHYQSFSISLNEKRDRDNAGTRPF